MLRADVPIDDMGSDAQRQGARTMTTNLIDRLHETQDHLAAVAEPRTMVRMLGILLSCAAALGMAIWLGILFEDDISYDLKNTML